MPVNPADTTPGIQKVEVAPKVLNMRCKSAPTCDSTEVIEVTSTEALKAAGKHLYQCVKCKRTWGVSTGGHVDL